VKLVLNPLKAIHDSNPCHDEEQDLIYKTSFTLYTPRLSNSINLIKMVKKKAN